MSSVNQLLDEIEIWTAKERDYFERVSDMEARAALPHQDGVDIPTVEAVEAMRRTAQSAVETRRGLEEHLARVLAGDVF
jgi:hypothetical protein